MSEDCGGGASGCDGDDEAVVSTKAPGLGIAPAPLWSATTWCSWSGPESVWDIVPGSALPDESNGSVSPGQRPFSGHPSLLGSSPGVVYFEVDFPYPSGNLPAAAARTAAASSPRVAVWSVTPAPDDAAGLEPLPEDSSAGER